MPPDEANGTERERDESGRVVETVTPDRVLDALRAVLREEEQPVATVSDIADRLGVSGESVRRKLTMLAEAERVDRMTVGARAVVWWPTVNDTELLSAAERAALDGEPEVARDIAALAENDPEALEELRSILGESEASEEDGG